MEHLDAYPKLESLLIAFLTNLVLNLDKATRLMGLPAETFAPVKATAQALLDAYTKRNDARKVLDTAQTELGTQVPLTEKQVREFIQDVKHRTGISPDVLDLLEINTATTDPTAKVAAETPLLRSKMDGIHPTVLGSRHGHDAIEIWCRRAGETDFTYLATVTHLPFFDNRPNVVPGEAEVREYYGYYQRKNVVVSGRGPTTIPLMVPGGSHA